MSRRLTFAFLSAFAATVALSAIDAGAQGRRPAPDPQIPSSDGVFHACVRLDRDGDSGRLARLVGADEGCRPNEVRVQWNQTGPQGPQGVPGLIGPQGEQGDRGLPGPPGTAGQDATTVLGSGALNLEAPSASFTAVPGLEVSVNVPADAVLLVSTDGGARVVGGANAGSTVEVRLTVDGAQSGPVRRISPQNSSIVGYDLWSLFQTLALAEGTHEIGVEARLVQEGTGTSSVIVSGSADTESFLRGALSIVVLKK